MKVERKYWIWPAVKPRGESFYIEVLETTYCEDPALDFRCSRSFCEVYRREDADRIVSALRLLDGGGR